MSLLDVRDLSINVASDETEIELVHQISLSLESGQTMCVVGESGSGKTVTALSIIRLLEFVAPVRTSGAISVDGVDITGLTADQMRSYRGPRIGMIFQEALDSLNPGQRVGKQLIEAYHPAGSLPGAAGRAGSAARARADAKARSLLAEVGLADTDRIMALYPHQMSGGMQQRVMIALALMSDPDLLIADEPTTALDVTTQAEILALFRRVQANHRMACLFITHDMGVAAQIADRVAVMYGGRVVEAGETRQILTDPRHHYTRALLQCVPQIGVRRTGGLPSIPGAVPGPAEIIPGCRFAARCPAATDVCRQADPALAPSGDPARVLACWHPANEPISLLPATETTTAGPARERARVQNSPPLLVVDAVTKTYGPRRREVHAVNDLSLQIGAGEFFGLVGESGSGKTSLGRLITAMENPSSGSITVAGHEHTHRGLSGDPRDFRRRVQLVFQDPQSSLDPRHSIERIIAEPLRELTPLRGDGLKRRVAELLDEVGLPASTARKIPSQLSGGQRQRVSIARAIAPGPELIVADEPTSALDVSVQGQVMNLLLDLKKRHNLSFLFITHNLSLVLSVADRVGVMYKGELIEVATPEEIQRLSQHDYTRRLLAANPDLSTFQRRSRQTSPS